MSTFLKYNLFSILWTLIILVLCLMPGKDLPEITIINFDKLVHLGVYAVLSSSMYYGWMKQDIFSALRNNTIIKILILTTAYGFAVEVIQEFFTADRHFELYDALANSSGAVIGCIATYFLRNQLKLSYVHDKNN